MKVSITGLNESKKVDWDILNNLSFSQLAENGLHADVIAKASGLTVGQVHYRCKQLGMKLRDYRDGKTPTAELIISRYTVESMSEMMAQKLRRQVLPVIRIRAAEVKQKRLKAARKAG